MAQNVSGKFQKASSETEPSKEALLFIATRPELMQAIASQGDHAIHGALAVAAAAAKNKAPRS